MILFFLKGFAIGAVIAMPFGPVGMLCLQRAIAMGLRVGLLSGMGAAAADAFYGAVAAFGLTFVSDFLAENTRLLQTAGGLFLAGMGVRLLWVRSAPRPAAEPRRSYAGAFVSIFLLTLTNPLTVVAFLAIFAGFGLGQIETHSAEATAVVAGVFCGSMLWWSAIALGGKLLRLRLLARMTTIKRACGGLILAFGLWAIFFAR